MDFEQVRKIIGDVPNINCGGCGIAAIAMKRWLLKNMGIDVPIVYTYFWSVSFGINDNALKNNDSNYS